MCANNEYIEYILPLLVTGFVFFLFPHSESIECLLTQHIHHWFVSVGVLEGNLLIDKLVIEAYLGKDE